MLRSISWMTFSIAILVGLLVYYGWWLVRYYPLLFRGKKGTVETGGAMGPEEAEGETAGVVAAVAVQGAEVVFLPAIAGALSNELSRLTERALLEKMEPKEVLEAVRALVGEERWTKLRGTSWEGKINDLIARVLEKYGPGRPDPEVVRGMWNGKEG